MQKHKNRTDVINLQRMCRTAKQCEAVITLGILRDVFDAEDSFMRDYYKCFKEETSKYNVWTPKGLEKARADFKEVAKTYNCEIRPDPKGIRGGDPKANDIILYTEATCLYIALRILRSGAGFNYKMLDEYTERYIDFNRVYEEGDQVDMYELSDDLETIIGVNILRGAKHGN